MMYTLALLYPLPLQQWIINRMGLAPPGISLGRKPFQADLPGNFTWGSAAQLLHLPCAPHPLARTAFFCYIIMTFPALWSGANTQSSPPVTSSAPSPPCHRSLVSNTTDHDFLPKRPTSCALCWASSAPVLRSSGHEWLHSGYLPFCTCAAHQPALS